MHTVLRSWLGIDDAVARALLGEPNHSVLIEKLRYAFKIQNQLSITADTEQVLNEILAEAAQINAMRSIVAHKPCWGDGISIAFSNAATSKDSKVYLFVCTRKQLTACAEWAVEVAVMLRDFLGPGRKFQARHIAVCHERIASRDRSLLPSLPQNKSPPTAKRKPLRQPSRK